MQEERTQNERIPQLGRTGHLRSLLPDLPGRLGGEAAPAVRAGHDPERAVLQRAGFEVDADGDHLLEEIRWRLHEERAFFLCPAAERRVVDALGHGDA